MVRFNSTGTGQAFQLSITVVPTYGTATETCTLSASLYPYAGSMGVTQIGGTWTGAFTEVATSGSTEAVTVDVTSARWLMDVGQEYYLKIATSTYTVDGTQRCHISMPFGPAPPAYTVWGEYGPDNTACSPTYPYTADPLVQFNGASILFAIAGGAPVSPTMTPSGTPTGTPTHTPSMTPSPSLSVGASQTNTPTPTQSPTKSLVAGASASKTPSSTIGTSSSPSPTPSGTISASKTGSVTSTVSITPTPSLSFGATASGTPTRSAAASSFPSATTTPTPSKTTGYVDKAVAPTSANAPADAASSSVVIAVVVVAAILLLAAAGYILQMRKQMQTLQRLVGQAGGTAQNPVHDLSPSVLVVRGMTDRGSRVNAVASSHVGGSSA